MIQVLIQELENHDSFIIWLFQRLAIVSQPILICYTQRAHLQPFICLFCCFAHICLKADRVIHSGLCNSGLIIKIQNISDNQCLPLTDFVCSFTELVLLLVILIITNGRSAGIQVCRYIRKIQENCRSNHQSWYLAS